MTFSIIIPCYKVEKYVRECLDSVLVQESPDWEAICVDDGSPDRTGTILDEYAVKDSRIKVIHQANGGLSSARNAALKIASGEWLYYLDSDDVMPPDVLRLALKALHECPDADLIYGKLVKFHDGTLPDWGEAHEGCSVVDLSRVLVLKYLGGYFQQLFYRRSSFLDILFAGPNWSEEKLYSARVMARARKLVELVVPTYGFRIREGSITHSKMTLEQCMGFMDAMRDSIILLGASGKSFDQQLLRVLWSRWFERGVRHVVEDMEEVDKPIAWRHWFSQLEFARKIDLKPRWFRFVSVACRLFPFRVTVWVLCYLPDLLKRK